MGIQAPAKVKYQLIHETLMQKDNVLNVSALCRIAGVSRSGYYAWINTTSLRQKREEQDKADFALIKQAYDFRGYKKGARSIYLRLLHMDPPVVMNLKKIRRLMEKYRLYCPIRGANPYRKMAKAQKTNHTAPNIMNRDFKKFGPRKALLTDITYLNYREGCCYLSVITDVCTHEVLAYTVSRDLKVDFVVDMIDRLLKKHGAELEDETIVHSDQGVHYTSRAFVKKLQDISWIQSMSRRGNCWDNAPQESFFGHMKDEIKEEIKDCNTYNEVIVIIRVWMDYYNKDRYQWDLDGLSPKEFYTYQQTGIYPLKRGVSKNITDKQKGRKTAERKY
ncbi:IS3 family transposase [uncultured Dubosiella sp.]|uniref:IS3 family transposase n=1 Tax=uncultured Dubosiella sp. TaxID=1937011 RepID=UPI002591D566|nr:IS3 family transposase [uncultured Dubosiella sp.]